MRSAVELRRRACVLQVLLGCDGGGSVIAKWAGLTKPQPVGQIVIRGLCKCEQGALHNLEPVYQHVIGKGVRLGLTPVTHDKVYWFLVFNASSSPAAQGNTRYVFIYCNLNIFIYSIIS